MLARTKYKCEDHRDVSETKKRSLSLLFFLTVLLNALSGY